MAIQNLAKLLTGKKASWYESEKNTAALLQAVIDAKSGKPLSGDDIWHLIRLTWVTRGRNHWKELKVPALQRLFPQSMASAASNADRLQDAIAALSLPQGVAQAAAKKTGIVNFYGAWRNSSRLWCDQNAPKLRKIIEAARQLQANDRNRLKLAARVDALPKISSPKSRSHASPGNALTPLIASLDPHRRFPIVNGRQAVQALLGRLGLVGRNLEAQVRGMTGLVGKFGISDALMLDVLADEIRKVARKLNVPIVIKIVAPDSGSDISDLDADERKYLHKAGTVTYRNRHNKMIRNLKKILAEFKLTQGSKQACRWDVLVEGYDSTGRDLLLEAKPDAEKAAVRIAIGQLLDYRRFVPRPAATDIAVLSITGPDKLYRQLLLDLQISTIWFTDEACLTLDGEGPYWESLQESLAQPKNN